MKSVNAILIDPFRKEISYVAVDKNDCRSPARLLGCSNFDIPLHIGADGRVGGESDDLLLVDDEALFKENQAFFEIEGYPSPIAGKALIIGKGKNGEIVDPNVDVKAIAASWLTHRSFFLDD